MQLYRFTSSGADNASASTPAAERTPRPQPSTAPVVGGVAGDFVDNNLNTLIIGFLLWRWLSKKKIVKYAVSKAKDSRAAVKAQELKKEWW